MRAETFFYFCHTSNVTEIKAFVLTFSFINLLFCSFRLFRLFRWFRFARFALFARFVSLFRVLVHIIFNPPIRVVLGDEEAPWLVRSTPKRAVRNAQIKTFVFGFPFIFLFPSCFLIKILFSSQNLGTKSPNYDFSIVSRLQQQFAF